MISGVNSAAQTQPITEAQARPAAKPATQSQPTTSTATDTVQISSAAQAALKEAMETSTQIAQEASKGDHQAQRLLAKEAAAHQTE